MLEHDTCFILVVEPKVLPFLPLQDGKLEAGRNASKNSRSGPPRSGVFANDDLAFKITPEDLKLHIAKGNCADGGSTRYFAWAPRAFDGFQLRLIEEGDTGQRTDLRTIRCCCGSVH